ncbi:MAG: peptidylprolyl isomerase [Neisseria sp.]|nr:peptidylprolyl isomerase [Neisseria sp.]
MKAKYLAAVLAAAVSAAVAAPKIDDARIDQIIQEVNAENAPEFAQIPAAELRSHIERNLQAMDALRDKALEIGLDKKPAVRAEWQNLEARFYAEKYGQYLEDSIEISDEELRRAYDERTRVIKVQQVRFDTVEQAKEAQQLLLKGLSFEELMARYPNRDHQMTDFVSLDELTPEIAAAVAPMKRGEISAEPVEYQQRFYLLKLAADQRHPDAPPFAAVKDQLLKQAKQQKAQEQIAEWLKSVGIETE